MATKIKLIELLRKIDRGQITEREKRDFFIIEPDPDRAFSFNTFINPEHVDVGNFTPLAWNADALVITLLRNQDRAAKARKKRVARRIVAEGDSWFRLPSIIYPKTCIDFLQSQYAITNLAKWGDTLGDILTRGEFWPYVDAGFDTLLFSAGGNDIIDDLRSYLNLFDPHHADESDAQYYIRDEFYDNLDLVIDNIMNGLILPLRARGSRTTLFMHGYDYIIPQLNGPWVGAAMMDRGLDPHWRAPLCRAIIRLMIDAFNLRLKALQSRYPDVFRHVDVRGALRTNDWYDELHAKEAGAKKIAQKFRTELEKRTSVQTRRPLYQLSKVAAE